MERHFDEELKLLKNKLLEMAGAVEQAIYRSVKSLVSRDEKLAGEVIHNDRKINELELDVEDLCLKLLALHQPMAVDLRFIAAAMKINNDLERMGDQAVNIAERSADLIAQPPLKPLTDIPRMAEEAQKMVKDSIDAFVNGDAKLAQEICLRDSVVDSLNDQVFRELLTYMISNAATIERAVDLILVSRHLERIADHATNIAEEVIYIVEGKVIKHHHLDDQAAQP